MNKLLSGVNRRPQTETCFGISTSWCGDVAGDIRNPYSSFAPASSTLSTTATSSHYNDPGSLDLAKEMTELSAQERERIMEEIHGVAQPQKETPESVQASIQKLDQALADIPKSRRKALDKALFYKPSIASDRIFKLMFLRAEYHDASKAATNIAKFFEHKLTLFGEGKLAKKITLEDLNEQDVGMLDKKGCLVLPQKDQAGRPIWFMDMTKFNFSNKNGEFTGTPTNHLRAIWYQVMASLEDEDAQVKGVFSITYCPGNLLELPVVTKYPDFLVQCGEIFEHLPLRITSYHFCYNDVRVKFLLETIQMAFGKHVRLRQRTHFGSDIEIEYSLVSFGVPSGVLFQKGGNVKQQIHEDFKRLQHQREQIAKQQQVEEEISTGIIPYPKPEDVLIGRGKPYQAYSGNRHLGDLIDANLVRYRECTRFEKTCITLDLVQTIQVDCGGRFIERTPNGWKRIDETAAREKISSGFRTKYPKSGTATSTAAPDVTRSMSALQPKYPLESTAKRLRVGG